MAAGVVSAWRLRFGRIHGSAGFPLRRRKTSNSSANATGPHAGRFRLVPGQWLAVVLALSGVAAFGLAPGSALDTAPLRSSRACRPRKRRRSPSGAYWREERMRRGDTIGSVLARLGVDDPAALAFLRTNPAARPLYRLRPGKPLPVETDEAGLLVSCAS